MSHVDQADPTDEVIYLLGISENASDRILSELVELLPIVKPLALDDATAWFVCVERNQFEGPEAEVNLSDANWLTPRVLAHEAAVEAISERLAFCPCHFGTIFSNTGLVEQLVTINIESLREFFKATASSSEWGLKCIVAWDEAVVAYQVAHGTSEQDNSKVGLNYLRQQKLIRDRDIKVRHWITESLQSVEGSIREFAKQLVRRRVNSSQDGGQKECLANFAVLANKGNHSPLDDFVTQWNTDENSASRFIKLELTGPWPLYSFIPPLESPAAPPIASQVESTISEDSTVGTRVA